jgi:hypothetical protein
VNINIQYQTEPKKLMYFYDAELALKTPISVGTETISSIAFPIVGIISFKVENDCVNRMTGIWYDINNTIYNLALKMPDLKGVDALRQGVSHGAISFKGTVAFNRWNA